jgi:hypothetical protein
MSGDRHPRIRILIVAFLSVYASAALCFPDASNTGIPAGTTLTNYTGPCTITTNTTIDAKDITATCWPLYIRGGTTTITRSNVPQVDATNNQGSVIIEDSRIDSGSWMGGTLWGYNITVRRSHVTGGQHNFHCNSNCVLEDSYLTNQYNPTGQSYHNNAFISNGGSNMVITGNTLHCDAILNETDGGCTSNLSLFGDFSAIDNVHIENNLFKANNSSISYCLNAGYNPSKAYPVATGIVVKNNIFERGPNNLCGVFGPVTSFQPSALGNEWVNNRWTTGECFDGYGNTVACVADTQAPTIPTNLNVSTTSSTQLNLSWTASTDDIAVAGYDIRRCSGSGCTPSTIVHSTTGTGTTWNDTGLSASTLYRYDVRARDAVPNYSDYSTIAQATTQTPADTTPPSVTIATADPSNITADSLTVTGAASDAVGVSGCKWRRSLAPNASNGTLCTGTTSFSCATSGYSQGANTLYVGCFDAAGNYGSDSMVVNYYPPLSAPTNLRIY